MEKHMNTLKQEPITVPVESLINEFGSYYSTRFSNNKFSIIEELGKKDELNEWEHQFYTYEEAYKSAEQKQEAILKKSISKFDSAQNTFIGKVVFLLHKFKLIRGQYKKNLEKNLSKYEETKKIILEKDFDIRVKKLTGNFVVPEYRFKIGDKAYLLDINIANPKFSVKEVIVDEMSIYDYRGSTSNNPERDKYDICLTTYFSNPETEDCVASIDFDRLVQFNGAYYETGVMNSYIFLDENKAIEFARNILLAQKNKIDKALTGI